MKWQVSLKGEMQVIDETEDLTIKRAILLQVMAELAETGAEDTAIDSLGGPPHLIQVWATVVGDNPIDGAGRAWKLVHLACRRQMGVWKNDLDGRLISLRAGSQWSVRFDHIIAEPWPEG